MKPGLVLHTNGDLSYRKPEVASAWAESLKRVARAQAIAWNQLSIRERQQILAQVDQEAERLQK